MNVARNVKNHKARGLRDEEGGREGGGEERGGARILAQETRLERSRHDAARINDRR